MKKRQSTKQKKEKRQESRPKPRFDPVLPPIQARLTEEKAKTVVSKYPQVEDNTEEKQMSTLKKDDSKPSSGGVSRSSREETPGEKTRREQDEAEEKGEVHSAITIDKDGNPVQEHTAGA